MNLNKWNILNGVLGIVFVGLVGILAWNYINVPPEVLQLDEGDVDVLAGGIIDNESYDNAGYLLELYEDGTASYVCGFSLIHPNVGLTAKHCIVDESKNITGIGYLAGFQQFSSLDLTNFYPVYEVILIDNPINDVADDLAVLIFDIPDSRMPSYTHAESIIQESSCGYEMIGYGLEEGEDPANPNTSLRKRKLGVFCVDSINNDLVRASGDIDTGACQGDSGSGLFDSSTNTLVGVSSAAEDGCETNNLVFFIDITSSELFKKSIELARFRSSNLDKTIFSVVEVGDGLLGIPSSEINLQGANSQMVTISANNQVDYSQYFPGELLTKDTIECGYIDINNDNILNIADFVRTFGKECVDTIPETDTTQCGPKDTDSNNQIDFSDFVYFVETYGQNCSIG